MEFVKTILMQSENCINVSIRQHRYVERPSKRNIGYIQQVQRYRATYIYPVTCILYLDNTFSGFWVHLTEVAGCHYRGIIVSMWTAFPINYEPPGDRIGEQHPEGVAKTICLYRSATSNTRMGQIEKIKQAVMDDGRSGGWWWW